MRMSVWLEAIREYPFIGKILAHDFGRGGNEYPSANDRWLHSLHSALPTDHYCSARAMDAQRQRRGRGDVRRGGERANGIVVEPAVHLREQYQHRALDKIGRAL